MGFAGGAPEMHEAGVVERRRRLEAGDMAAEFGGFLVGAHHDRRGIPADVAADRLLELAYAGMRRLVLGRDGVDVGGVGRERQFRALAAGRGDDAIPERRRRGSSPRKPRRNRARRATRASRRPSAAESLLIDPPKTLRPAISNFSRVAWRGARCISRAKAVDNSPPARFRHADIRRGPGAVIRILSARTGGTAAWLV